MAKGRKPKFTADQVKKMKELLDGGQSVEAVAKQYKTSVITVYKVKKGAYKGNSDAPVEDPVEKTES